MKRKNKKNKPTAVIDFLGMNTLLEACGLSPVDAETQFKILDKEQHERSCQSNQKDRRI